MYRRKIRPVKPKELVWPDDLEQLGLFINEDDELRQIAKPEERFDYFIHGKFQEGHPKERLNERRREAVDQCLRKIVVKRLQNLGLNVIRVPLGASEEEPHMKILVSDGIETAKKVMFLAPDSSGSDLGIWGIRLMEEETINKGSMIDTVKAVQEAGYHVILANPSQIIWDPETRRAMNFISWKAKDKKSPHIHDTKNRVPGIEDPEAHLRYLWDKIVKEKVPEDAIIDVVAVGYSSYCILMLLQDNWDYWEKSVFALVFGESSHHISNITSTEFRSFVARRARNYIIHNEGKGKNLFDRRFGCATFSSGEIWASSIIPSTLQLIMEYFESAHENPDMCNPDVPIIIADDNPQMDSVDWMNALRSMDPDNVKGWDVPLPEGVTDEQMREIPKETEKVQIEEISEENKSVRFEEIAGENGKD
ncbi:hypothetical protein RUND412_008090 [Rhizina undulata]